MTEGLLDVADELYGVPPAEFVAARNDRAAARRDDRALAARIRELRRPAPAAWAVNLLVRHRRDALDELLDLGVELRTAQHSLDREAITRLGHERRDRVTRMAQDAGALAVEAGHPVAPAVVTAVAATLDAGLADAGAADAIRSGRLLRPLETIGFEPVDLAEAIALPEAGSRAAARRAAPSRPRPRAVDDVDAELVRARTRADGVLAAAESIERDTAADLAAAESRLRDARKALVAAERDVAARESARDAAATAHDRALDARDAARARRRELG